MAKKSMLIALFALLAVVLSVFTTVAVADAPSASASHILVPTEAEIDDILATIEAADDLPKTFAKLAKDKSKCPSGRSGGALGTFGRGQMVPEFDRVVFEKPVGVVHKVKTQFGWHLVLTTSRSGVTDADLENDDNAAKDEM